MTEPEIRLELLMYADVARLDRSRTVTVIPTGSIEPHGPRLPLDTDAFLATEVALAAGRRAKSGPLIITPTVSFGSSEHHMAFPGTLSLQASTFTHRISVQACCAMASTGW